jgi:hypothetical protein
MERRGQRELKITKGTTGPTCGVTSELGRVGPVAILLRLYSLSLVLGGEGRGEGPGVKLCGPQEVHVGWVYSPTNLTLKQWTNSGRVRPPYMIRNSGASRLPPLTLSLSPEYEGEGTRADLGFAGAARPGSENVRDN